MDEQRAKGTETYAEAAARLLAGLDERAKKASGSLNQPEQIQETGGVRRVPANENREKRAPQRGGVSRGARSCLSRTGGVPAEGKRHGVEKGAEGVGSETWLSKPDVRPSATSADSNVHDFTVPCEQRALGKE